jgi:hypothetical protein
MPRRARRSELAESHATLEALRRRVPALVGGADRAIATFARDPACRSLGFVSYEELLGRLLDGRPILRALVGKSRRASETRDGARESGREDPAGKSPRQGRKRNDRTEAVDKLAQLVAKLAQTETELAEIVGKIEETLAHVEAQGIHRQAAFPTFEEYLERAFGPDVELAALLAARASRAQPAGEPGSDGAASSDLRDAASIDASLFGGTGFLTPEPSAGMADTPISPEVLTAQPAPPARLPNAVLGVLFVAAVVGAVLGWRSGGRPADAATKAHASVVHASDAQAQHGSTPHESAPHESKPSPHEPQGVHAAQEKSPSPVQEHAPAPHASSPSH